MTTPRPPFLLIIRSGPNWDIEKLLRFFGDAFSEFYEGAVVTWSSRHQSLQAGRFRVLALAYGPGWLPGMLKRLAFTLFVVLKGLWIRWARGRRLVVIAYDPFQSGAIGLALRWFAGAKFVCEVNGVYGHPDLLIDLEDPEKADAKRRRMLRVGSFILRRAHRIKLLFPDQLMGFSVPEDHPPRHCFFDMVNSPAFEPTGLESKKQIIFVGHPYLLKGVDLLLEAFSRIAPDFPDWRLLVVGWRIEESARKAPFPLDRVEFRGPQEPSAIRRLMEESAVLVLPSRSEGMPRVLIEAGFLGRARIASRVGGIPHLIEDGVDGLLFAPGDGRGLEDALRRFLGVSELEQEQMGLLARKRALREFTIDAYMKHYRHLIDNLLEG